MGCPQLRSVLCCSLPSGVLAIGITCLVLNALGGLLMAALLASPNLLREAVVGDPELFEDDEPVEVQVEQILRGVYILFGVGLAAMVVCAVLDIALIVATKRKYPRPLLVWSVWYSLVVVGNIGFGLYVAVLAVATSDSSSELWTFILSQLAAGGTGIYFVMAVFSYYRVLREQDNGGYRLQRMTTA